MFRYSFVDLKKLIGEIFHEDQIYEILHFDIEGNFNSYSEKFIHIYFSHLESGKIHIDQVSMMQNEDEMYAVNRKILGQQGWIEIYDHEAHVDLTLFRKNRSGKVSIIGPELNMTQKFHDKSYDLPDVIVKLTEAERRQAFAELAGLFDGELKASKPKKAV